MPHKTAKRIVRIAYDPAYASEREQLAQELGDWHRGPMSGLFAVSNAWLQGGEAPPQAINKAIGELHNLLDRDAPSAAERQHVEDLKAQLEAIR